MPFCQLILGHFPKSARFLRSWRLDGALMEITCPYVDHFDGCKSWFILINAKWSGQVQGPCEVLKTAALAGLQVRVLSPPPIHLK
jgi:hypothetical protein